MPFLSLVVPFSSLVRTILELVHTIFKPGSCLFLTWFVLSSSLVRAIFKPGSYHFRKEIMAILNLFLFGDTHGLEMVGAAKCRDNIAHCCFSVAPST